MSSLQMDYGLRPTAKSVFGQTNILTMVIRFVDTPGKHIDLIKQEATSFSHCFAGGQNFDLAKYIVLSTRYEYSIQYIVSYNTIHYF